MATRSLRAEQAVAGVAEAGHDVALLVEALVDRGGEDRHVRVDAVQLRDALGRGEQADELDLLGAALLEPLIAATAELPVASIGSTTITRRSRMSSGTLK